MIYSVLLFIILVRMTTLLQLCLRANALRDLNYNALQNLFPHETIDRVWPYKIEAIAMYEVDGQRFNLLSEIRGYDRPYPLYRLENTLIEWEALDIDLETLPREECERIMESCNDVYFSQTRYDNPHMSKWTHEDIYNWFINWADDLFGLHDTDLDNFF